MTTLRLINQRSLDDSLVSLEFVPSEPLTWEAGQFIKITAPHTQPDAGGASRFYTVAAAPHEGLIRLVTRRGPSSFKQTLLALQPGEAIELANQPAGDVVWGDFSGTRVMVASGVGITPFYAMLKAQAHTGGPATPTELWYFHPRTKLPFAEEFASWAAEFSQLTIHCIAETYAPEQLVPQANQLRQARLYLSGPMSPTKFLLPPFNLKPGQIVRDTFTGYAATDY